MVIVKFCLYILCIKTFAYIRAILHVYMHMLWQIHIHVYSLDIMLASENKIGFRCVDKYNNQGWSIQFRTVRLNNVLHFLWNPEDNGWWSSPICRSGYRWRVWADICVNVCQRIRFLSFQLGVVLSFWCHMYAGLLALLYWSCRSMVGVRCVSIYSRI